MRIVVVGCSGAGKTTLAGRLARGLKTPCIEVDAINWQPNWWSLAVNDPEQFREGVIAAIHPEHWVLDGNYSAVRDYVWRRATHLIWLDYSRWVVMSRVIRRSMIRIAFRVKLYSGNQELWRNLLSSSHPIRSAWNMWDKRRRDIAEHLGRDEFAHIVVLHLRHPSEVSEAMKHLSDGAGDQV
jgi:adenylate kinase family enzyme